VTNRYVVLLLVCTLGASATAQERASLDRPLTIHPDDQARFARALSPFIEMGRATYPAASEKFARGLPEGYRFYVVVDLKDSDGHRERVFVLVASIDSGVVNGSIASQLVALSDYGEGDAVAIPERDVKDWTIVAPDGSEEGNYAGKFLDHYRPGKRFSAVFGFSIQESGQARNVRLVIVSDETAKPLDLALPNSWVEAAIRKIAERRWEPKIENGALSPKETFVPFIYDPDRPDSVIELGELSVTA
jgi:hypothetical protein